MRIGAAVFCVFFLPSFSTYADELKTMDSRLEYLFGGYQEYKKFFYDIKDAIAEDDRERFSTLIHYPFSIYERVDCCESKVSDIIEDKKEFVERFDEFVTDEVRVVVSAQEYEHLFANWKGIAFEGSVIWFGGYCLEADSDCTDVKIGVISIFPPDTQ